jgi:UDP-N-acetylmuramate--alanine ligase
MEKNWPDLDMCWPLPDIRNMDLKQIESVYFLGIGGIGMSALARFFHRQGKQVMGYDKTRTALTIELELEGMAIHYDDHVLEIPEIIRLGKKENILLIYTPAIPKDSHELNWFIDAGYRLYKRSEVLGLLTQNAKSIAVAGTHGKTTTSAMIAHILEDSGLHCNAFLGGITGNYNTNMLIHRDAEWTVVEADEFDRSFLTLSPTVAAITSMDADHLDIYGNHEFMIESFNLFAARVVPNGYLFCKSGLPLQKERLGEGVACHAYGMDQESSIHAANIHIAAGRYVFDWTNGKDTIHEIRLGLPGRHNVENAVAAIATCRIAGVSDEAIKSALESFKGVKRRFDYALISDKIVVIDDYAHHPEELRAAISSARELFPDKKISGVFQPHLFTRTRDFADGFAETLGLLDEVVLLPIYPAREKPIEGVHSQMLLDKIVNPSKILVEKDALLAELLAKPREVIMILGAGDIDTCVAPLVSAYTAKG